MSNSDSHTTSSSSSSSSGSGSGSDSDTGSTAAASSSISSSSSSSSSSASNSAVALDVTPPSTTTRRRGAAAAAAAASSSSSSSSASADSSADPYSSTTRSDESGSSGQKKKHRRKHRKGRDSKDDVVEEEADDDDSSSSSSSSSSSVSWFRRWVLNDDGTPPPEVEGSPVFDPLAFRPYPWGVYRRNLGQVKDEVLSGVTVAFAQVPESIAFAFLAGVPPAVALHAAWIVGLIVSLFGSRPGMIAGATGAVAAVVAPFVRDLGIDYLFPIVILGGVFEVLAGALHCARFVRLIPVTVMTGFKNGLALVIGISQLHAFRVSHYQVEHKSSLKESDADSWIVTTPAAGGLSTMLLMLLWVAITVAIIHFLPKLTKIVPASMVAIGVAIGLEQLLRGVTPYFTPLVGEVGQVDGGLPTVFSLNSAYSPPDFSFDTLGKIIIPAFTLAAVTVLETLMTIDVVEELTTPSRNPNQQIFVLGIATIIAGIFGTMGGGAMIGLTTINIMNGANGRFRISGVVTALIVLIVVSALSIAVAIVPTAALVGVMLIVVVHTFQWDSIRVLVAALLPQQFRDRKRALQAGLRRKMARMDVVVIIVVTVLTLLTDLFFAVGAGVLLTALVFTWNIGAHLLVIVEVDSEDDSLNITVPLEAGAAADDDDDGDDEDSGGKKKKKSRGKGDTGKKKAGKKGGKKAGKEASDDDKDGDDDDDDDDQDEAPSATPGFKLYRVEGPIFFASVRTLHAGFDARNDPDTVEIDLSAASIYDFSGVDAFNTLHTRYTSRGKTVRVVNLNQRSWRLIHKVDHLVDFSYQARTGVDAGHRTGRHPTQGALLP